MDLFPAIHATWPAAATRALGPYTLRDGAGGGGRASAASLDGAFADPGPAIAAMVHPLFMVRAGQQALDEALAARGFGVKDPTALLAAPAERLAFAAADLVTIACDAPLAAMAELWAATGIGPARQAVMARAPAPKLYLLGRLDDRPAGAAFAAIHAGTAVLSALVVLPEARRRGLGARLTRAAAAWARDRGAVILAVAVARDNAAACALYAGLGLQGAGSYHYRIAPEAPR